MIDVLGTLRRFRLASLIPCLMALGLQCNSAAGRDHRIDHVTIVSPERSSPMRDATVYIQGDRIVSISHSPPSSPARSPGTAVEVIDGKGLYLVPRLIDNHVHTGEVPGPAPPQEPAPPHPPPPAPDHIPR